MRTRRTRADNQVIQLRTSTGQLVVPVEIRRCRRSRHIRLWLGQEHQAVLSVPWFCGFNRALYFLRSQADWLQDQLAAMPPRQSLLEVLRGQKFLSCGGREWPLVFDFSGTRAKVAWQRREGAIKIILNPFAETETGLTQALREFAREEIVAQTEKLGLRHGLPVKSVTVRNQISRWGSCTTGRAISLNWRLVLLRAALHDYVILHELAHFRQMNHSEKFWAVLKEMDPCAKLHDYALTRVSRRLMAVGR